MKGNEPLLPSAEYDDVVVAYDHMLTSIVKIEVLNNMQFDALCRRLKNAGFTADDHQLIVTFLRAMRED